MSEAQLASPLRTQALDTQRKRGQLDTSGEPPNKKSIVTKAWWALRSLMPWSRSVEDEERVVTVEEENEDEDEEENGDYEEEEERIVMAEEEEVEEEGEEEEENEDNDEEEEEQETNGVEDGNGDEVVSISLPFNPLNVYRVPEIVTLGGPADEEQVITREVREQEVLIVETPEKTIVHTRTISPTSVEVSSVEVTASPPREVAQSTAESDPEVVELLPTTPSRSVFNPPRTLTGLSPEITTRVMEYVTEQSSRVVTTTCSLHSPSQSSTTSVDREKLRVEGGDEDRGESPAPEDSASRQATPKSTTAIDKSALKRDTWRKNLKRERDPYRLTGRSHTIGRNSSSSGSLAKKTSEKLRSNSHRSHGEGNYDEGAKQRYLEIMEHLAKKSREAALLTAHNEEGSMKKQPNLPFTFTTDNLTTRQKMGIEDHKKRLAAGKKMALDVLDDMFPRREDGIPEEGDEQADASRAGPSVEDSCVARLDESSASTYYTAATFSPNASTLSYQSIEKLNDLQARIHEMSIISASGRTQYELYKGSKEEFDRTVERLDEEGHLRTAYRLETERLHAIDVRTRLALQGIVVPEPEKVVDEFPELSDEAERLYQKAWYPGPEQEKFRDGDPPLLRKDLKTLSGLSWLNDEVILAYMNLIVQRSKEDKNLPSTYAFNTFFYGNISNRAKGFPTVKRWTRKVDIFSHEILLIPVHLSVHWTMAVVDVPERTIYFYDSMSGQSYAHPEVTENIMRYLEAESMDKRKIPLDPSDWELACLTEIPQQQNGSDCGVFACKFADFASRRAPFTFSQSHMPYYRKRMVYQLCQNDLAAH